MTNLLRFCTAAIITAFLIVLVAEIRAQRKMDSIERGSMKTMLSVLKGNIKDNYYDPEFHGIDLDTRFEKAKQRLREVQTTSQAMAVIAQVLMDFDDSHLYFLPPATNLEVEYGYRTRMIGDKCIVTTVKPKSDAEKKGLQQGDQLIKIQGFRPTRKDMWKINYFFGTLSKRGEMNLGVLKPTAETPIPIVVKAKVKRKSRVITRETFYRLFDPDAETPFDYNLFARFGGTGYWRMPTFSMSPEYVNNMIGKVGDATNLIIDLRGNGGGAVVTLERLAAFVFDRDLVIATPKGRKKFDLTESKTKGRKAFKGKLIVLIDSASGSASEIFARVVQLEERGVVLGDVSAGAVMMSRQFVNTLRNDSVIYGASITMADVIMPDGKSLEHVGVTPNAVILPTPADIAENRDPVLSEALKLLGSDISPAEVGSLFEYEWRDNGRVALKPAKKKKKKK